MKQLKFKAYHKKSQQMYDVLGMYQIDEPRPGAWSYDLILPEGDTRAKMDSLIVGVPEAELEILEFVDAKDLYGKEIYTGLIVDVVLSDDGDKQEKVTAEVVYKDHAFKFLSKSYELPVDCICEIKGNIYQNPELLK